MLRKSVGDVVVIGAGVAGCSAFYHLAKLNKMNPGFKPILVDALSPLSLTSANGSFSYRNWYPSEAESAMRSLVTASIDELDEIARQTNNGIELNRNGYLFVTRDPSKMESFKQQAQQLEQYGGGALRIHDKSTKLDNYSFPQETLNYDLDGTDLLVGIDNIQRVFPSLQHSKAVAALHVRRCGSLNPFKLANYQLTRVTQYCPQSQILRGTVADIYGIGGRISGVKVKSENGEVHHISTPNVVFATGPLFENTLEMLTKRNFSGFSIPIINELHARAVMDDPLKVIKSTTPLTFDSDHVGHFELTDQERIEIEADPSAARLLGEFPSGVHVRPYMENKFMSVWTYDTESVPARYPVEDYLDQHFPEACLRGLCRLYPQLKPYLTNPQVRKSMKVNGGYYCKTLDNMPLIGPAPETIEGVFLQSAMSGIGLMSSGASGHLLACHVMGVKPQQQKLAQHMNAFVPNRFMDKTYMSSLGASGNSRMGQV